MGEPVVQNDPLIDEDTASLALEVALVPRLRVGLVVVVEQAVPL